MFSGAVRILSVVMFLTLCIVQSARVKRVIGGKEVACGTQRRIVSLRNSTTLQHLCGATLLSPHFALTAAHCVSHGVKEYVVQLNNYCAGAVKAKVLEILIHGMYDVYSREHDIALIRVSLNVDDTTWLNGSVLPASSFGLAGDCTMYGYGYKDREMKTTSELLLAGDMKIVSLDECLEALGPFIAPKPESGLMCALGDGVDSCQGDSGGPLICNGVVQGVSSYGMSCGVPGLPGVYTSVGTHLTWIRDVINTSS